MNAFETFADSSDDFLAWKVGVEQFNVGLKDGKSIKTS